MTLWELGACVTGWNASQGGETALSAPTDKEFEALKLQAELNEDRRKDQTVH